MYINNPKNILKKRETSKISHAGGRLSWRKASSRTLLGSENPGRMA